jgi:hypothetical protein
LPRGVAQGLAIVLIVVSAGAVACTPKRAASSQEEYFEAACAAWESLFRAVGNPDTASGSDLSRKLDEAVAAGDVATAERAATEIARELKVGREHLAVAAGWQPRTAVMAQFDRLFAAFEAGNAAKLAAARKDPDADDPQAAFERAGGLAAWTGMFEAARAAGGGAATDRQCPNVPVTP